MLTLACGLGGCAVMPDIAPDWALPMREIMLHSACELQDALGALDHEVPPELFNARNWKIAITLNPKSEADIVPGAGLTRRDPVNTATRFSNWVVGGGNGVALDMRGNRAGSVDFNFDSEKLILDRRLPCERETISYHSLTKNLAVKDWLYRSVQATALAGSTIENPKFTAQVVVKFNGSASYTYTFPVGTDLLTLGGYYQLDETLSIVFTKKPAVVAKYDLVTLPAGGAGFNRNQARPVSSTISILEDQQLSLQQIRQQLQNIRPVGQ
ncbi:hypothetical protein D4Q52_12770 [Rhodopseudomonas palustris]|uniref:Uncharacterized protein n=2 Tax=Rhodopseudomonas palustris TaxID=1076 RepID=A0A418VE38_RHOPL|nr:hypothetical protein D4Q52_12770 [Rhodopseudomonas palustris]